MFPTRSSCDRNPVAPPLVEVKNNHRLPAVTVRSSLTFADMSGCDVVYSGCFRFLRGAFMIYLSAEKKITKVKCTSCSSNITEGFTDLTSSNIKETSRRHQIFMLWICKTIFRFTRQRPVTWPFCLHPGWIRCDLSDDTLLQLQLMLSYRSKQPDRCLWWSCFKVNRVSVCFNGLNIKPNIGSKLTHSVTLGGCWPCRSAARQPASAPPRHGQRTRGCSWFGCNMLLSLRRLTIGVESPLIWIIKVCDVAAENNRCFIVIIIGRCVLTNSDTQYKQKLCSH